MPKPVKVYNKGTRPIIWKRSHKGTEVIHPGKFDIFSPEKAKELITKFDSAVSEEDFNKAPVKFDKKESGRK